MSEYRDYKGLSDRQMGWICAAIATVGSAYVIYALVRYVILA